MPHTIEPATSGRSNCPGCGEPIAKDELRFGERLPNAFGDGEMTIWFHLMCAACKRPESLLEVLGTADAVADATTLRAVAEHACAHPRLTRIGGLERAPSGRARCRACRELVEKNAWRIALVFFQDSMFSAGGFVHLKCAERYFETPQVVDHLRHFTGPLSESEMGEIEEALRS